MTLERDAASLFERMHLVIALTEVNSRHLRGESRRAGAQIELACALASAERDGVSQEGAAYIEQLRERLDEAECALRAIESERDRLANELAHLDCRASSGAQGGWQ
ncbi:hypothetical protein [Paraburkholderia sp. HP33-1]|uniref:hypothetical protein n=1 Tax=Paraburkholderia sp. HP33-1 TaxID=2883243 RepID=UPI001F2C1530|nr:hypothetical protein [Paraburkholderia sp. HP33-1]